jgi:hypothetical protein
MDDTIITHDLCGRIHRVVERETYPAAFPSIVDPMIVRVT